MTGEKVLEVISVYRRKFEDLNIPAKAWDRNNPPDSAKAILRHCHYMLTPLEEFVQNGRMEKAFRWLGFVQGVLWAMKMFKISELKDHNKP